jgi:four helix bundle protein
LQEQEETTYWLELLVEGEFLAAERLSPLRQEAQELTAILVSCSKTAKQKKREEAR